MYHSVIYAQNKCRECSGYAKLTLHQYYKKAAENNYKFISVILNENEMNTMTYNDWQCLTCGLIKSARYDVNLRGCAK